MKSLDRILVVLDHYDKDFENSILPVELRKALRFVSSKRSTRVQLVVCGYEKYLHDSYYNFGAEMEVLRQEHCRKLESSLARIEQRLRNDGYLVESRALWGFPRYEQIISAAVDFKADLVVQHTRGHARLARTFLTNDSWQLVRCCPKPLLLVKDREWKPLPVVMAAVDPVHGHNKPQKLDHRILEIASSTAAHLGGSLHVLHAYAEAGKPFVQPERIQKLHYEKFNELLADFNIPQDRCHLVNESPVFALQQYESKLETDITVMGALSRSRLNDALIGNTAEKVLDYLDSDVLVVKPRFID